MHKRTHISMLALVCSYSVHMSNINVCVCTCVSVCVHVCLCIFAYIIMGWSCSKDNS